MRLIQLTEHFFLLCKYNISFLPSYREFCLHLPIDGERYTKKPLTENVT